MYIEKKKKPQAKRITSRPTTLARLKKSCWIRPPVLDPAVCRPVIIRCARTGGIRRPIELCMYNPPTQKALGRLRGTLFDGLCMDGQPAETFLAHKSPASTPQRRKRARKPTKEDLYEEPPKKRSRNPRRIPRTIPKPAKQSARAPGEVPQPKAPGPGYCHNCKKARDSCIVCPNVRTHRFCTNCVSRHFAEDYEIIFNKGIDCWVQRDGCPVCFWQCPCAACKRRMQNRKNKAAVQAKARELQEYEENVEGATLQTSVHEDEEEQGGEDSITENGEDTYEIAAEAEEMEAEDENEEVEEQAKVMAAVKPGDEEDDDYIYASEGMEGYVEEQDSEQEDDALHDPKHDDSGEYNIEGHTHSEEDMHEHEEKHNYSKRKLQVKKRRFMDKVESQSEAVVEWAPHLCENDALEEGEEEEESDGEEEEEEEVKDTGRHLNWTPVRIMARRQRGGQKEYFVMWKDRWLNGDDTVSLYSRGELKEIMKKRKRKRHPIEYLVRRKFSWENEAKVPQRLLEIWSSLYQTAVLQNEKGKGKGKGEGWDLLWQNEQRKRQASATSNKAAESE